MKEEAFRDNATRQLLGGVALGALAMFLADPGSGRRRRARAKSQVHGLRHSFTKAGHQIDVAFRDLRNRTYGIAAQAKNKFMPHPESNDDHTVASRIKTALGRVSTHPRAIQVTVEAGKAIVSGTILTHEKKSVLRTVSQVRGVQTVEDRLQTTAEASSLPSMQGTGNKNSSAAAPSLRPRSKALLMMGGSALSLYGIGKRNTVGKMLAAVGAGVIGSAFINISLRRLLGQERESIRIQKTIYIEAPIEQVFDAWSKYENFPRFMSHIKEVQDLGDGRSHWIVEGPAGTTFEWDAELTECRPSETLAWQSNPGAEVQNRGEICFEPQDSGTRVSVHMSYRPPAGAIGHAFASLTGRNPKQQINEDLMRMKQYLESSIPPVHIAQSGAATAHILH